MVIALIGFHYFMYVCVYTPALFALVVVLSTVVRCYLSSSGPVSGKSSCILFEGFLSGLENTLDMTMYHLINFSSLRLGIRELIYG